tara:strand:+ start:1086 stop:1640 length:555 start_codon:yes stop_codon:yes gene_type:complete
MLELIKMAYFAPVIPGLDLTYQFEKIRPLHNNEPLKPCPGTLWDFLVQNAEIFSIYKFLVSKADLEYDFNGVEFDSTVFIPSDKSLEKLWNKNMFMNMEKHQAMRMIKYNSLPRQIRMKELTSSESMKIDTRIRGHLIYTNSDGKGLTMIGEKNGGPVNVVNGDIIVNNALVHLTDNFLLPEMS